MAQKRNILLFLTDILQEIEGIERGGLAGFPRLSNHVVESYVALGKQKFLSDETIQKATFFRLQTIGEAVNKLPEELKAKYPNVPWRDIVSFRNLLVHRYWRIDLNVVWAIMNSDTDSIVELKPVIQKLIKELSS